MGSEPKRNQGYLDRAEKDLRFLFIYKARPEMAPGIIGTAPKWSRIKLDPTHNGPGENGADPAGSSGTPKVRYYITYYITARSQIKTVAPRPLLESQRKTAATVYGGGSRLHCMRQKRAAQSTFSCSNGLSLAVNNHYKTLPYI